jgi:ABC-2 type transport system permease protein
MLKAAINGDTSGVLIPAAVLFALGVVAGSYAVWRLARGWGRTRLL